MKLHMNIFHMDMADIGRSDGLAIPIFVQCSTWMHNFKTFQKEKFYFKFIDSSDAVEIYEQSVNFLIWMLFHKDRKECGDANDVIPF